MNFQLVNNCSHRLLLFVLNILFKIFKDTISKLPTSSKPSLRFQTNDFIINENNQLSTNIIEVGFVVFSTFFRNFRNYIYFIQIKKKRKMKMKLKQRIQIKECSSQANLTSHLI
jgi:hypothetical protein